MCIINCVDVNIFLAPVLNCASVWSGRGRAASLSLVFTYSLEGSGVWWSLGKGVLEGQIHFFSFPFIQFWLGGGGLKSVHLLAPVLKSKGRPKLPSFLVYLDESRASRECCECSLSWKRLGEVNE